MNMQKYSGIRRKVLIVAVIPAATVTVLLTLFFSFRHAYGLEDSLRERGLAIVRQLGPASEYGVYSGNPELLSPLVHAVMNEIDVQAVSIYNATGKVLISRGSSTQGDYGFELSGKGEIVPSMLESSESGVWIFKAPIFQTEFVDNGLFDAERMAEDTHSTQLIQSNRVLGWVVVEVSLERTHAYQAKTWINAALIALIVLLVSTILAKRLGRSITNPITMLKRAVDQLENGNFDVGVNTGASGELKSLEVGINKMAKTLKASRANLEEQINQATSELRETLRVLEERNTELNVARMEAETANTAKSNFLANISHEIRTPLNGTNGFLMLLDKTELNEEQRDYVEKIQDSTKTLLTLLNDILDFSKLEISQVTVAQSEFNFRDLLDESICVGIPEANRKGVDLALIVAAEVPARMIGGADRIAQAIKNLVSNAVKFTSSGEVVVHADLEDKTGNNKDEENTIVRISVTDTGIGISHEDQERLFQPFSQLETGMNRRYNGSGLGLVITKSLVELMDGSISFNSIPGKGSRFSISLPLKICTHAAMDLHRYNLLKNQSVLVVSPNRNIVLSLQEMFRHWRMQMEFATTVSVADELICRKLTISRTFKAIIVDGCMSGSDVTAVLKHSHDPAMKKRSHFILLDHQNSDIHRDSGMREKFIGILSRPPRTAGVENLLYRICMGEVTKSRNTTFDFEQKIDFQENEVPHRVLVADDNIINRQYLSIWLKKIGIEVEEAIDGKEAIMRCQQSAFDLILMDLHMPNIDGVQAVEEIRRGSDKNINVQTPVIAVTADATDDTGRLIESSGFDDYLVKPLDEEKLFEVINKWCVGCEKGNNGSGRSEIHEITPDTVVDRALGLRFASGDMELWYWALHELVERLEKDSAELTKAIEKEDLQQIRLLAHRVKGAASYCGASELLTAAGNLQTVAAGENIASVHNALIAYSSAVTNLLDWVSRNDSVVR